MIDAQTLEHSCYKHVLSHFCTSATVYSIHLWLWMHHNVEQYFNIYVENYILALVPYLRLALYESSAITFDEIREYRVRNLRHSSI